MDTKKINQRSRSRKKRSQFISNDKRTCTSDQVQPN